MTAVRPFLTELLRMSIEILILATLGGVIGAIGGHAGVSILSTTNHWTKDVHFSFLARFWTIAGTTSGVQLGCLFFVFRLCRRRIRASRPQIGTTSEP